MHTTRYNPEEVGFQSRFHPLIRRLRSMIESRVGGADGIHVSVTISSGRRAAWCRALELAIGRARGQRRRCAKHSIHSCGTSSAGCSGPCGSRDTRRLAACSATASRTPRRSTIEHEQRGRRQPRDGVQRRAAPRGAPARSVLRASFVELDDRFPRRCARRLVSRATSMSRTRSGTTSSSVCAGKRSRAEGFDPDRQVRSCTSTSGTTLCRPGCGWSRPPSPDTSTPRLPGPIAGRGEACRSAADGRPTDLAELSA